MPASSEWLQRLDAALPQIATHFGTPFHIYDEKGIRATGERLKNAFGPIAGFREYYAVKALPNPHILRILFDLGFGFDCSSIAELVLARQVGARGEDIMFTSNNTTQDEFDAALADGGCLLNLDDISLIDKVPQMPETICFRYNPGPQRGGNVIIGNPVEAKYGVASHQILEAYRMARARGAKRFGLHTMLVSNERDYSYMRDTVNMLLDLVTEISATLGIRFDFINMGGGLGIPYRPEDKPLDLEALAAEAITALAAFQSREGYAPALHMESGRYITGPHGVLVTRAINHKDTYRRYIGVDANMASLMRPGMYGAYHHASVVGKGDVGDEVVDIVGSLCENSDKLAIQRSLPRIEENDLVVIHDTGAHGHSMGYNYNARLRPQELLWHADGRVTRIRRAETLTDYFATLDYDGVGMEV
jgi:diaminopimelate decarboxylase